jgi:hypothetical protein
MKKILSVSAMMFILYSVSGQVAPETIVEDQVKAYNQKDLALFCSFYSEDIKYYDLKPDFTTEVFIDGQAKLKETFETIFKNNPGIQCEVAFKTVLGNKVILKEKFSGANRQPFELVFIYVVLNDKIQAVMRLKKQ